VLKRVRYGVVGIRGIGDIHLRAVRACDRAELVAIADIDDAALQIKARELNVPGFTDYREMLEAGLVDAVSIATPHGLHARMGLDCLNAGVHIYMEKPLAIRLSEADRLIEAAHANGRMICVGHQYRVHRSSRTPKSILDAGTIGQIMRVLWTWADFRPATYFAARAWKSSWREAGGGTLSQFVSHDLDLLCWLLGRPRSVIAFVTNQFNRSEIEDTIACNVVLENGAIATFQATSAQPQGFSVRQIAGDRGMLVMPDVKSLTFDRKDAILLGTYDAPVSSRAHTDGGTSHAPKTSWQRVRLLGDQPPWIKPLQRAGIAKPRPHGIAVLLRGFVDAILDGGASPVAPESARTTLELLNAILLSAIRRKVVDLPLDPAEVDDLYEDLISGSACVPRMLWDRSS
jgi:predicted dehydrogenase